MQCEYDSNARGDMCHPLHVSSNVLGKNFIQSTTEKCASCISDGKVNQPKKSIGQAKKPGGSINEICAYTTHYLLEVKGP